MATITSWSLKRRSAQAECQRVMYEVVILDDRGESRTHSIGPRMIPLDADVDADLTSAGQSLLERLAQNEISAAIAAMESGENPLRDGADPVQPRYAAYNDIVAAALRSFLKRDDPTEAAHAAPLIDLLSDVQIKALLSIDDAKVVEIRALAAQWGSVGADIADYRPVI